MINNRNQILEGLNLEPIMVKAMDEREGYGWSLAFAKRVADEYRKYLILCVEHPRAAVVPSNFVDEFWHLHILDTQKYQADCDEYLGFFLHHFPYFGMRGEQDALNLKQAWADSCALYVATFGSLPTDLWSASNRCPNCGSKSKDSRDVFTEARPMLSDLVAA